MSQVSATTTQALGTGPTLPTGPQNWDWQSMRLLCTRGWMAQVYVKQQGDPMSFRTALRGGDTSPIPSTWGVHRAPRGAGTE